MPTPSERLARARRSANNINRAELRQLYVSHEFEIRRKTKHAMAIHPRYPHLRGTLPNHADFAKGYVLGAVKLIEELRRLQKQEEHNGDGN